MVMQRIRNKMKSVLQGKDGQGMTEYIIIVAMMAVACILIYKLFGEKIGTKTKDITTQLETDIKIKGD